MHVINTTTPITVPTDEHLPDRLIWIGQDDRRLELEVVGLVELDYLLIIYVMPYEFRRRRR